MGSTVESQREVVARHSELPVTRQTYEWRAIAHVRPSLWLSALRDITRCVKPSLVVRARRATPVAGTP